MAVRKAGPSAAEKAVQMDDHWVAHWAVKWVIRRVLVTVELTVLVKDKLMVVKTATLMVEW